MRRKGTKTITIPVLLRLPTEISLPPEFERYVVVKATSDLLALEAQKTWRQMFDRPVTPGKKTRG